MTRTTIALAAILMLGACAASAITLAPSTYDPKTVERYEDGGFRRVDLLRRQVIESYLCIGRTWFWDSGKLQQFTLDQLTTISRVTIPAGSTVFLRRDGSLRQCWFSATTLVKGLRCRPGSKSPTIFHQGGGIQWCYLAEDTNIKGIKVQGSPEAIVGFHANGRLSSCTLARDTIISGRVRRAGTKADFDHNGNAVED